MRELNSPTRLRTTDSRLQTALWRALSPTGNVGDALFRLLLLAASILIVAVVGAMIVALATDRFYLLGSLVSIS